MCGHHLENCLQPADDRAVGAVFAFGEPAQAVEVTEELVGAFDEVNDHFAVTLDYMASRPYRSNCSGKLYLGRCPRLSTVTSRLNRPCRDSRSLQSRLRTA